MKIVRRLSCVFILACVSVASAHVHLKQSVPAQGAVLAAAPTQIVLTFDEPALVTALWIQQDANPRQKLSPLPTQAAATVTVPVAVLKAGSYVVTWRAVSPDRHVMSGALHFKVS
jgi:methionine-rich copper-binding protein CopC